MPEGDTLWRTAARLHPALAGRTVVAFRAHSPALAAAARRHRVVDSTVTGVEARGKHLLIRFSTDVALHTHMGMTGSWHLYRPGSRWRQPEHLARVVVETADVLAVCFVPRVAELLPEREETSHPTLASLGPDASHPSFDIAAARTRLRARPEREIGAALLDQSSVAGIGNIHKSETLFACGVNPFAQVALLDDATLDAVLRMASRRLRASIAGGRGEAAYREQVYRRARLPCRRCGTPVERRMQGDPPRSTYWCPGCQAAPGLG